MKKFLTIISLFFASAVNALQTVSYQPSSSETASIKDQIEWKDFVNGFYISIGYASNIFSFDSTGKFLFKSGGCMGSYMVDSGRWSIREHNLLVLQSKKKTRRFKVLQFGNYRFFLLPQQEYAFHKDMELAWKQCRKMMKSTMIGDRQYHTQDFVAISMIECYYMSDLLDVTN